VISFAVALPAMASRFYESSTEASTGINNFRASGFRVAHRGGAGREKKFQNHQDCKFCLNEIKYLRLLIFGKVDFFSRPLRARRKSNEDIILKKPSANSVVNASSQ
jgi:hypothetical protein